MYLYIFISFEKFNERLFTPLRAAFLTHKYVVFEQFLHITSYEGFLQRLLSNIYNE